MSGRRLMVGDEGSGALPAGWHDELVCHTCRENRDGTVTVIALVNLYTPDGRIYSAERTIRLSLSSGARARGK